jgi:hypothetical protein
MERFMTRPLLYRAGALLVATALATAPTATLASRGERDERDEGHRGKKSQFRNIPVNGITIEDTVNNTRETVNGFLDITGFTNAVDETGANVIYAVGVLKTPGNPALPFWAPIQVPSATKAAAITAQQIPIPSGCNVLHLVLGPLQLNLLGLVVTIPDPVTVDITAVPGGGLLGDLLCAVANLLGGIDLNAILTSVLTNLLNQVLGLA